MASTQTTFKFTQSVVVNGVHIASMLRSIAEDKGKPFQAMLDFKDMLSLHGFVADKATAKTSEPVSLTFRNKALKADIHICQIKADLDGQCECCGAVAPAKSEWCNLCNAIPGADGGDDNAKVMAQL